MHALVEKRKWLALVFIALALLTYFILPESIAFEGRIVLSVLVFAGLFWGFELIPLYASSLWVVIFLTLFFSFQDDGTDTVFFSNFANPLILLFLGGFVLAAAVRKTRLDEAIFREVLAHVGSNSYAVLGALFVVGAFFSMWISNIASCAMMLALSKPLFDQLEKNDPMRKALPLSIAFSTNIGAMATPIGTPPNAIAMGVLREFGVEVNFFNWMLMAFPLLIVILGFAFLMIIFFFPPKKKAFKGRVDPTIHIDRKGLQTACIAAVMIVLWLTGSLHGVSETWVALLGVGLFASLRILEVEDIKSLDWDILILMWGGLALGSAIGKSGLLEHAQHLLTLKEEFIIIGAFCVLAIILSAFISNTATANLLLPFAVGLAAVDTRLIAVPVALCCSIAMILPVSTPQNALAYSWGTFSTKEIGKVGSSIAVVGLIVILLGLRWIVSWSFS